TEVNVAHLGTAVQSSNESSLGAALHGVDDNYSPSYFHGSCTSTGRQNNPWWRLELPGIYAVTLVTVVNRADDCCWKDLKGAEVRAGELLERHGNINPRCGQVTHATRGSFHMFCCCGKTARYVNIVLPGRSRVLSLCEVAVLGVPISEGNGNVALQGEAVQSSTYNSIGDAENAIDNNWSAALYEASCTLTEHQPAPWWRVDLRKKYRVSAVVVKNRQDCCFRRLKGAEVRLGDSLVNNGNDNYRCGVIKGTYLGSVHVLSCAMRVGRYVNVLSRKTTFLTLCEVEVYG
ncbi:FUCL7 protein, partial [Amia calva]|nr:FUCL7 protein [Amia calva]